MRTYDINFKQEAIKLAKKIGFTKAANELNIPSGTMDTWISKAKTGKLTGKALTPKNAMTLEQHEEATTIVLLVGFPPPVSLVSAWALNPSRCMM